MIRIGILGNIGSGKSYVAKSFGYPVFNADYEVSKLYKKDKKIFNKLKKKLPKFISSFPINKNEITKAILAKPNNLKEIINMSFNHSSIKDKNKIKVFKKYPYGLAKLVVAIPTDFIDIFSMADLEEVAFEFKDKKKKPRPEESRWGFFVT